MFGKRIRLFKLFGFEVNIDVSWFFIAVLITWSLARGVFPNYYEDLPHATYWIMGILGTIGLFFSIVFHELCHSIIARRNDLPMKGITLFLFGGVAHMSDEPPNAKTEFLMAIAGPISSIILGLILWGARVGLGTFQWPEHVYGVINYLAIINFVLAGFNLLPAFPLDGGRVLRSILWSLKGNLKWATDIASKIGTGFGFLLIVLGIYSVIRGNFISGIWWVLIGMFLRNASQMSYRQVFFRQALEGEPVRHFMKTDPVAVSPSLSVEELVEDYFYKYHFKMFPVVEDEKLVGCVTVNQVKEIPKDERATRTVRDLLYSCSPENTIDVDEDAVKALSTMNRSGMSRLMVVDDGDLVGVITLKDMLKFLALKIDLER
jgi:Zn-dependent protease